MLLNFQTPGTKKIVDIDKSDKKEVIDKADKSEKVVSVNENGTVKKDEKQKEDTEKVEEKKKKEKKIEEKKKVEKIFEEESGSETDEPGATSDGNLEDFVIDPNC